MDSAADEDECIRLCRELSALWESAGMPECVAIGDIFMYKVNPPDEGYLLTKRNFLRKIATLFDPLGFLNPYVIRAKILLQEMWTSGLEWDDLLDENLARNAKTWFTELKELAGITVPRCLQLEKRVVTTSIHTFTDASGEAYAAAIYARQQYDDGSTSVRLVVSKSRVAPLQ
eukprot:Seg3156.3 transcript_id=Seg3156.3/GoldUCD/mRNA.D3Y31 product="hypothetical protein" protein_id=Seg3156.3/GoldUCD/D3Y31